MAQTIAEGAGALERARALAPLIAAEADAAEAQGRLTDAVAGAMLEAGLFGVMVPKALGGLGGSRSDYLAAVEAIARADGSAGWCASVCNAVSFTAGAALGEEGRAELFGAGPATCWASLTPSARAVEVEGGYRVSTRGAFGSGSSLAAWVMIASPLPRAGAGAAAFRGYFVPRGEVAITAGSWEVMGLKATASQDYVIEEVFVPASRTYEYAWSPGASPPGTSASELAQLNAMGLAAFASGIAKGAMAELIEAAGKTRRVAAEGLQAEDNLLQFGLGELEGRLKAARLQLFDVASRLDETLASGRAAPGALGLEAIQAAQTLARAAREMVILAFDNASASVIYTRHPLQRRLRDIFAGLKHASFTPALLGRIGKVRLGLDYGGPPF